MAHRSMSLYRRAAYGLACTLVLTLLACSGGSGDSTGPGNDPPVQDPTPLPAPVPGPGPGPGPQQPDPSTGIAGTYALFQINNSKPGQMVTISNPDGKVIGLYRFDAGTQLVLEPLQTFDLQLRYTDEKGEYGIHDQGEFKQAGSSQGVLALTFSSATYGDAFSAIAADDVVAIKYDFDGDGQFDTVFGFQRVGG